MFHDDRNREEARLLEEDFFDWFETADAEDFGDGILDGFLEELERVDPLPGGFDPQKSLDDFHEKHTAFFELRESGRRQERWSRRAFFGVAAVVAALASIMTAQALDVDILGIFSTWTDDIFTFTRSAEEAGHQERLYPMEEGESMEFQSLEDALAAFQIDVPVAPTWFPERFSNPHVKVIKMPYGLQILAEAFVEDDEKQDGVTFICSEFGEEGPTFIIEKDENTPISYESGGIAHYILVDNGLYKAAWVVDHIQCVLSGNVTEEEMKQIIDSIYSGEHMKQIIQEVYAGTGEKYLPDSGVLKLRYDSIAQALGEFQFDPNLEPRWLPERFSRSNGFEVVGTVAPNHAALDILAHVKTDQEAHMTFFYTFLEPGKKGVIIEKNENNPVLYESGGVTHYIMFDHDLCKATWMQENIQCIITGPVTEEEMKQIIDSIHFGEDMKKIIQEVYAGTGEEYLLDSGGLKLRYDSIAQALEEFQFGSNLEPRWLPERFSRSNGFEVTGTVVPNHTAMNITAYAKTDQEDYMIFSYMFLTPGRTGPIIEKDENDPILYESGGVTHYIMFDHGYCTATWIQESIQSIISGTVTEEEMKQMIDSIYS